MEDGVGIATGGGRDPQAGARGELADHRLGHQRFRMVGVGAGLEDGNGKRAHRRRQVSGRAQGVVAAAGE